jgi:hypothetical protein|tara:strand:+ start:53 stop:247 length:195 start_codon:yes stop_codon:yes gene_type:complete
VRDEESARDVEALRTAREQVRWLFDQCDPDGSGFVSLDEIEDGDDRFADADLVAPRFGWHALLG